MDEGLTVVTPYVTRLCRPIALSDCEDAVHEALTAVFVGMRGLRDPQGRRPQTRPGGGSLGLPQRLRGAAGSRLVWCPMQSRFVVGGMVATPEGDGTRFAVLGAARPAALRPLRWAYALVVRRRRSFIRKVAQRASLRPKSFNAP